MPHFSERSMKAYKTLDPRLQRIFDAVIKRVDFVILEGHRDEKAQNIAFEQGKSQKRWPNGKHNAYPSKAADIGPYIPGVVINWNDLVAFGRLMGYIQATADSMGIKLRFGLDWDGDWRTAGREDPNEKLLDAPHVEIIE